MPDLPIEFRRVNMPQLPKFTGSAVTIGIAAILMFGVKYFCRSTSTILAGSDGCSFDDAPFAGRCCGF